MSTDSTSAMGTGRREPDHEYEVRRNGAPVAEISKRWFSLRDTYAVDVASGRTSPSSWP